MNFREMRRQKEAAFFTEVINHYYPTANPEVTVRRLDRGEERENTSDTNQVTVEFTGPSGDQETFTTSSRNLMRDDDPGRERIANYLFARLQYQRVEYQPENLRAQADSLTEFIDQHFPTADPWVAVRPLEPEENQEYLADRYMVHLEFTAPDGERETFNISSRDLMQVDDSGKQMIALHLSARLEYQPEIEEEAEQEL